MINKMLKESAEIAVTDAEHLDEISLWIKAYSENILLMSGTGELELKKTKSMAVDAIKILVRYI